MFSFGFLTEPVFIRSAGAVGYRTDRNMRTPEGAVAHGREIGKTIAFAIRSVDPSLLRRGIRLVFSSYSTSHFVSNCMQFRLIRLDNHLVSRWVVYQRLPAGISSE